MSGNDSFTGTETDRSFFVEAGAGSGKTTGLVARMINMVEEGIDGREIDISEICAITFTNAAAKEFYGRFRKKLTEEIELTKDEVRRERCKKALENIDLCFMGTIDSFCNTLLSAHPNEAAIPASASVLTSEEFSEKCRKEYERMISGKYDDPSIRAKAALYCMYIPANKREELFCKLMDMLKNHRESEIVYSKPKGDPDVNFKREYDSLRNLVSAIVQDPSLVWENKEAAGAFEDLKKYAPELNKKLSENIMTAIYTVGGLKKLKLKSLSPAVQAADPGIFSKAPKGGLVVDEESLRAYYGAFAEEQYSAAIDFVCSALKTMTAQLRSLGKLTFFDYLLYLRDLLRDDAAKGGRLISYISRRYKYYLVDEFQDTDPLQAEILFYLTAEKPVENWYECVPRKGSLYIVGDPKQSIYSFKGADVRSFMNIRSMFDSDDRRVLKLNKNYRSTPSLCRWFNSVFNILLPTDTADNSRFEDIPVDDDAKDICTNGVYYYKTYEKEAERCDKAQLPQIINRLVGDPSLTIRRKDKYGKVYTDSIRYSDIMVIVPQNDDVGDYMQHLTAERIPVMAEGRVLFSECKLLKSLYLAVAAVASPDDGMAVYAALTSGLFGITQGEFIQLRSKDLRVSLYSYSEEALKEYPNIQNALETLHDLHIKAAALSPSAAADMITAELDIFRKADSTDMEYLCYARELLRNAECGGEVKTLKDAAAFFGALIDGSIKQARCISLQKGLDRVRLANLHKVKGLEAPVVILAAPGGSKKSESMSVERTNDGETVRVFDVKSGNYPLISTALYSAEKEAANARREAEQLRLMYVAATRAKDILIISAPQIKTGLANGIYWKRLAEHCKEDQEFFTVFGAPDAAQTPAKRTETDCGKLFDEAVCTDLTEEKCRTETYTVRRPSDIKAHKKSDEDVQTDAEDTEITAEEVSAGEDRLSHVPANVTGTMAHRLMEILVTSKGTAKRDDAVSEIISDYWQEDEAVSDMLCRLWDTMMSGGFSQENGREADLLGVLKGAECHCEFPFCTFDRDTDTLVNGVMDLVYCKDDKWYIVDYKTNIVGEGLDDKYASQLAAYREALKKMLGVDAESYIYHLPVHTSL